LKPIDWKQAKKNLSSQPNYAAEVLAELERNDTNKIRKQAMREMNREVNDYLKFDADDLMS
jgi:hypothetical protein